MLNRINVFRKLFTIMTVLSLLTGSALLASPVLADSIITVTTTNDNTNSDGFCSLREAIINANDDAQTFTGCPAGSGNDTISFDNALGTATVTLTSAFPFITDTDGLAIDGGSDIRVSGDSLYQVLYVPASASLTLQNLTIINGKNSTGGGIYNGGSLTITNTTFTNNMATLHGGGIFNDGTLTVTNSLFLNNNATAAAGGIVNNGSGTIIVKNSTFIGNTAASAGAIYQNDSGTLFITNSTFADNTAVNYGGSIYTTGETIVTNSTFSSNGSGISGSDIVFSTSASPTLSLYNNILANNDTSIGSCAVISGNVLGNNNLIEDATSTCGLTNGVNGNIIGSDPTLGSLTGSPAYFPLNAGSLAIDAGSNAICAAAPVSNTSQNGVTRPQGVNCDIGAYEYQGVVPLNTMGNAIITSSQALAGTGRLHLDGQITAYNSDTSGDLNVSVPMLFKNQFGGAYDSALYVQNTSPSNPADITINFFDVFGSFTCSVSDSLPPLSSKSFWLPNVSCLPDPWSGGVNISSSQPISAVARSHIGSELTSYNDFASGSNTMYVPMLFKHQFDGSYDSALYVQNMSPSNPANITIKFYDVTGAFSGQMTDTLQPLSATGYWIPNRDFLPYVWSGGAVVSSDQPIVAIGRPHIGSQVTAYNGFAAGSTSINVPMLFKNKPGTGGSYSSAIYVQNVDPANPATVTLSFYDDDGSFRGSLAGVVLPSFSSTGFWLPFREFLPDGWSGSAVVTSDHPIVALGRLHVDNEIMTYNGSAGSSSMYVPMLFEDDFNGSNYDAALFLQNTQNSSASVTVTLYKNDGSLQCTYSQSINPYASANFWLEDLTCP